MTKKEYVLKVLDKVKGYWDKEPIIREYVTNNDDTEYLDYLYDHFTNSVDAVLKEEGQAKVNSLVAYLDQLKLQEAVSKHADEEDLKKLDELLQVL